MIRLCEGKGMNPERASLSLGPGAQKSRNAEKETGC